MLVRVQGKRNPHTLLVEMEISTATMEINMEVLQKTKNRAGGVAQVVEHLLSNCEALSSNPSMVKKKKQS
jgi:hypothetical protein